MTAAVDINELRQAAAMLRTPTASWHREAMAATLEKAADRGARKARRPRKAAPTFAELQVARFLKQKYVSRAHVRAQGDWPIYMEHAGTVIEDGKTASRYLKGLAA